MESAYNTVRIRIQKCLNPMELRGVLSRHEFDLVVSNTLQFRFDKKLKELEPIWNKDNLERSMMQNLRDDYEGMMEHVSRKPIDKVKPKPVNRIADTYSLPNYVYKTIRRLPFRNKVEINLLDQEMRGKLLHEIEYEIIRQALLETNGIKEAAKLLGMCYRTVTNKLSKYEKMYGIQTRFEVESNTIKDVILTEPKAREMETKPIKRMTRKISSENELVDYKTATKCEHTWKGDWLNSGLCIGCYKKNKKHV